MKVIFQILAIVLVISCRQKGNTEMARHSDSIALTEHTKTGIQEDDVCVYDNSVSSLGIGLVIAPAKFTLYNDSKLKDKFIRVDMDGMTGIPAGICSKFFMPDYGIMHFVCLDSAGEGYKILSSYDTEKYVPRTHEYTFKSWNDYILHSFGIRRLASGGDDLNPRLPLRKEPSMQAESLAVPAGLEMFCPLEVQGDWVKVTYECFYNEDQNPHEGQPCYAFIHECNDPLSGWIKWRSGNQLLIDIFLMP